ncbi:hypothetical protein predicted by Glimmer/Critica [Acetobacter senegalensis]|uniref:Uncharacterized protein n=1 Tax=Acetobacter senegalensis TaxID=446692 RepID=A0A0U4Y3T7_9PROT|nr:hypothetical protein [Acetobacter senegalensis]CEF41534.1 hypothetical protein predicted by Glimmer/Critica [Acetobacter senegalensis]
MTQQTHILQQDISFLRALAEAGQRTPFTFGPFLLAGGLVFGVASVIAWAASRHLLGLEPDAIIWIYGIAMCVHGVCVFILARKANLTGASSFTNQAMARVWQSIGWCILTVFLAALLIMWRCQTTLVWALFPSLILGLYGTGWLVAALISGQKWLQFVAGSSFVGALLSALFINSPYLFLLYGSLLVLLLAVPGGVLMRKQNAVA